MTPEGISTEDCCLKLHVYNTSKKTKRESVTLKAAPGPDALFQTFMHTIEQSHRLNIFVGTAVYTPAAGHVYLASDDENWVEMVCADGTGPPPDPVNVISGEPLYPKGRLIDLNIYNSAGGTKYKSSLSRDSSASHARLLRRFMKALEYCNGNQFAIHNAVYTDDDACINVSAAGAAWAQGLDGALRGLP